MIDASVTTYSYTTTSCQTSKACQKPCIAHHCLSINQSINQSNELTNRWTNKLLNPGVGLILNIIAVCLSIENWFIIDIVWKLKAVSIPINQNFVYSDEYWIFISILNFDINIEYWKLILIGSQSQFSALEQPVRRDRATDHWFLHWFPLQMKTQGNWEINHCLSVHRWSRVLPRPP